MKLAGLKDTVLVEIGSSSCSGIIVSFSQQYIVTHASILLPFFESNPSHYKRLLKNGTLDGDDLKRLTVRLTVEETYPVPSVTESDIANNQPSLGCYTTALVKVTTSSSRYRGDGLRKFTGHVQAVWKSKRFADTIGQLFPHSDSWRFLDDPHVDGTKTNAADKATNKHDEHAERTFQLLPCFVLIKVLEPLYSVSDAQASQVVTPLTVGTPLVVVGTPFGNLSPPVFLNSQSKGIVCNVTGSGHTLILTDARCIPGTEGGAIYAGYSPLGRPVGMIVAPLCWKANEWIGLALGCHLAEIYTSYAAVFRTNMQTLEDVAIESVPDVEKLIADNVPTVLVQNRGSWGTGIVVDQPHGLVLTCSHVVKAAKRVDVRVDVPHATWFSADVVYAVPIDQVFDIAVLKIRDYESRLQWPRTIAVARDPTQGDESYVIGHAAWGREHNMKASIMSGVISKVVYHSGHPVIIQSTCGVHAGASGGPLVNKFGELLGVVVCNAKDTSSGASYPHVNLSIPAATIWPTIETYIRTGDASVLSQLYVRVTQFQQLWTLQGSDTSSLASVRSKL